MLLLQCNREVWCFRTRFSPGDRIEALEVEAAAVADAVVGPMLAAGGYGEELAVIDNNVSGGWITSGTAVKPALDGMLAGMWLQLALRKGFEWWVRVSSASDAAATPNRGLVPDCPCDWHLRELQGVRRWHPLQDGQGPGRPFVEGWLRAVPCPPMLWYAWRCTRRLGWSEWLRIDR